MDGLHHHCQHRIEEFPGFLWIAVGEQLHRPLEVGEENGDLLALAFESRLGREDLLGQVLRGIGLRGGKAWLVRRRKQRVRTLWTELCRGRSRAPAVRACASQRSGAFLAELRPGPVFVPTLRTLHQGPLGGGREQGYKGSVACRPHQYSSGVTVASLGSIGSGSRAGELATASTAGLLPLVWGGFCQGGAARVLSIFSSVSFFVRPGKPFLHPDLHI